MKEKQFANNLIVLLQRKNLTQKDLCFALNIQESVVSRWLTGTTTPSTKSVEKIAKFFGVPVGYFYGDNLPPVENKIAHRLELLEEKMKRLELEIELLKRDK